MVKKTLASFVVIVAFLLVGCSAKELRYIGKKVNFEDWTLYNSDVYYYHFVNGSRIPKDYPSHFALRVADDKSYVQLWLDMGYDVIGTAMIHTDSIEKDTVLYRKFLAWSKLTYLLREESKNTIASGSSDDTTYIRVVDDVKTKEPLFLIVRHYTIYPDIKLALTVSDVKNFMININYIKFCKDHNLEV